MNSFTYLRASDPPSALGLWRDHNSSSVPAKFLAGGTNLIDLMREEVEQPPAVIDLLRVPLTGVEEMPGGGLRVGAMVKNSHLAAHPLVRERYPLLSYAILH